MSYQIATKEVADTLSNLIDKLESRLADYRNGLPANIRLIYAINQLNWTGYEDVRDWLKHVADIS